MELSVKLDICVVDGRIRLERCPLDAYKCGWESARDGRAVTRAGGILSQMHLVGQDIPEL